MKKRGRTVAYWLTVATVVATMLLARGCHSARKVKPPVSGPPKDPSLIRVTGYCNCGKCCSWKRDMFGFGRPVYNYGPMKGRPKKIGITASGSRAKHGTIAADPMVFPFGTHLEVPGYGVGTVEDIGGSIKGRHIDVWFPSHEEARRWGSRWLKVRRR